jgi:hypothetical protein
MPEIDIWRAAQLMLKRYGDKALEESALRADELWSAGDDYGRRLGAGSWSPSPNSPTRPRPAGSTRVPVFGPLPIRFRPLSALGSRSLLTGARRSLPRCLPNGVCAPDSGHSRDRDEAATFVKASRSLSFAFGTALSCRVARRTLTSGRSQIRT